MAFFQKVRSERASVYPRLEREATSFWRSEAETVVGIPVVRVFDFDVLAVVVRVAKVAP